MSLGPSYEIFETPRLQTPCLIVGWNRDIGGLGSRTIEFLINKLDAKEFARIKAVGFFPLSGVPVEENVIHFPRSRFYFSEKSDVLIFNSDSPNHSHYDFLALMLDIVQKCCTVREMYTLGGIISLIAHTGPRRVSSVVNQSELKQSMADYGVNVNLEYETPIGARPTLSSLLLWMAQRRNIVGANLWVDVPFYLAALDDPRSCKEVLSVLDRKLILGLDFTELDEEANRQNMLIALLKEKEGDIHKYISMLERGIMLSEKESEALANKVAEFLHGS